MDHPLTSERMEYSDSLPGPYTIFLHENWKGAFDLGSYDGGSLNPPCKVLSDAGFVTPFQVFVYGDGSGMKTTPADTSSHCLTVSWPAPHLYLTNRSRDKDMVGQDAWNGSLVDGMRDASGQMYRRNRYYDPQSARFTQEDPIGIAGGLNVSGFAGGDPVSYGDPYGLTCPDPKDPRCTEGTKIFTFSQGAFAAPGGGTVVPFGVGMNGNVGVAVDNNWNVMVYGTYGPSLSVGAAAKANFGAQHGNLNSLVSPTGKGGGVSFGGVAKTVSGSILVNDDGSFAGVSAGEGRGVGGTVNLTAHGKGVVVMNLRDVYNQAKTTIQQRVTAGRAEWEAFKRQAYNAMTKGAGNGSP